MEVRNGPGRKGAPSRTPGVGRDGETVSYVEGTHRNGRRPRGCSSRRRRKVCPPPRLVTVDHESLDKSAQPTRSFPTNTPPGRHEARNGALIGRGPESMLPAPNTQRNGRLSRRQGRRGKPRTRECSSRTLSACLPDVSPGSRRPITRGVVSGGERRTVNDHRTQCRVEARAGETPRCIV